AYLADPSTVSRRVRSAEFSACTHETSSGICVQSKSTCSTRYPDIEPYWDAYDSSSRSGSPDLRSGSASHSSLTDLQSPGMSLRLAEIRRILHSTDAAMTAGNLCPDSVSFSESLLSD